MDASRPLDRSKPPESAMRAVADAGHTIIVSGLAVAIGFCALFLVNVPFLRSMALQMAMVDPAVRAKIVEIYEDGSTFGSNDYRAIWLKLFAKGILLAFSDPTTEPIPAATTKAASGARIKN